MNTISEFLARNGVKPSLQRLKIYEFLHTNRIHPTADTIYLSLSPGMPTLSKTTVYNTLKLLVEKGVVRSINIEDTETRYDADTSNHAHFKCRSCGGVFDVKLNGDEFSNLHLPDFKIDDIQVNFKGFCGVCKSS